MAEAAATKTTGYAVDLSLAAAIVATLLGAYLRFNNIAADGLWMDEAASWLQASLPFPDMLRATAGDNYPPIHNITLFATLRLFGDGEAAMRLPSVIFGILTVPAAYLAARELFGRFAGVATAFLVATAEFQIHYAQEARMYSAFAFFAALSLYGLLLHLRRPSIGTGIAFVLATSAMLYAHFYALFTLVAEGLFVFGVLIVQRAGPRILLRWLLLFAAAAVLFLPWAYYLIDRTLVVQQGFWIGKPTLEGTLTYFQDFSGSVVLLLAELALLLVAVLAAAREPALDPAPRAVTGLTLRYGECIMLMLLWLLLPLATAYGLSYVLQPFLMVRYVIAASLAWYILAGAGFAIITRRSMAAAAVVAVVVTAGAIVDLRQFYQTPHRPDLRAAVSHVVANKQPGDAVIGSPEGNRYAVDYYLRHDPSPSGVYNGQDFSIAATATRVWLVTDVWDECISGEPGVLAARRPLIQRTRYFRMTVCLYGPVNTETN